MKKSVIHLLNEEHRLVELELKLATTLEAVKVERKKTSTKLQTTRKDLREVRRQLRETGITPGLFDEPPPEN